MAERGPGIVVEDYGDGKFLYLVPAHSRICAACDEVLVDAPALFLFRPVQGEYDPVCRECGTTIVRAAAAEMQRGVPG